MAALIQNPYTPAPLSSYGGSTFTSSFAAASENLQNEIVFKVLNEVELNRNKQNDLMMIMNCKIIDQVYCNGETLEKMIKQKEEQKFEKHEENDKLMVKIEALIDNKINNALYSILESFNVKMEKTLSIALDKMTNTISSALDGIKKSRISDNDKINMRLNKMDCNLLNNLKKIIMKFDEDQIKKGKLSDQMKDDINKENININYKNDTKYDPDITKMIQKLISNDHGVTKMIQNTDNNIKEMEVKSKMDKVIIIDEPNGIGDKIISKLNMNMIELENKIKDGEIIDEQEIEEINLLRKKVNIMNKMMKNSDINITGKKMNKKEKDTKDKIINDDNTNIQPKRNISMGSSDSNDDSDEFDENLLNDKNFQKKDYCRFINLKIIKQQKLIRLSK